MRNFSGAAGFENALRWSRFLTAPAQWCSGKLFPFCFITIACGAISGFHTLIASGTTPKILTRESYARPIGYGAMCLESLVAIMALIAACTLDPGVYLSMNMKGAPDVTVAKVNAWGFPVTPQQMEQLAAQSGEKTLFGRTGGAATLAVGMSNIFSRAVNGRGLDLWYHFAIMFEALFILTTLDAGTRVGRYLLQDILGNIWKPLGDTKKVPANLLASGLVVAAWGYFLIQGVRDPLGGINSLWPLFGIANQLLAAIALCLATTVILKMQLSPQRETGLRTRATGGMSAASPRTARPMFALVTLLPLLWLLSVTMTAGLEKVFHNEVRPDFPRIGFLQIARELDTKLPGLQTALTAARQTGDAQTVATAAKAVSTNRALHFNNLLDAVVTGFFLVMVAVITVLSLREWFLLLARKRAASLQESEPVWLPEYAVAESKPLHVAGLVTLGCALAKELSGEAHLERAQQLAAMDCHCDKANAGQVDGVKVRGRNTPEQIYLEATGKRFDGIKRCC